MKPTGYLVNTARGPIVDEHALETLQQRKIAAPQSTCFSVEPLPVDHPFRKLDNLVLTASRLRHRGSFRSITPRWSKALTRVQGEALRRLA